MIKHVAIAFVLFFPATAFAASKMYISEYATMGVVRTPGGSVAQIGAEPVVTDQAPVDYSGGVASSAAVNDNTSFVRVLCTATCSVKFGTNPTASASNKPLAAGAPEYFAVPVGKAFKISVIANSDF